MLKTSSSESAEPRKGGVSISSDSRVGHKLDRDSYNGSEVDSGEVDSGKVDGGEVENNKVKKKVQKMSKSKNLSKSKKMVRSDFFTLGARLAFTKLRQAFIKAPILYHFDPEHHIQVETDALSYAISGVPSQLTLKAREYLVTFFLHKMIPAETRYKTYDDELLAIIKAFMT